MRLRSYNNLASEKTEEFFKRNLKCKRVSVSTRCHEVHRLCEEELIEWRKK